MTIANTLAAEQANRSEHVTNQTMKVSEIFGPVCQGEGNLTGRPTIFVRFGGCDYRCAWCDSLYAVLPEHRNEWESMTADDIVKAVTNLLPPGTRNGHVTLSGGNPAIQPASFLIDLLHSVGIRVAIETQGSIAPKWLSKVDDLTLSPKPPSSGNITPYDALTPLHKAILMHPSPILKVVAFNDEDYAYAQAVHRAYPAVPFWLQAGTNVGVASRDDLCDALEHWQDVVLADPLMQDVHVGAQIHAILKGHARGI